jgi:hypothetical protein
MKYNQWTLALASAGVISLGAAAQAEEAASTVMTAVSSTVLSGYVDTSAIWKFGSGNSPLPGRSFDGSSKQDGFNLNVVKLSLEKALDESEWSAGYKVDLLMGPDADLYNQAFGATTGTATGSGDFGIKQAYVALRAPVGNGLDFKMGVFDTIIGYEVFESPNNPNYSRSYGWGLEPTQHTGLLASYRVADWLSVAGGIANTYNAGINGRGVRMNGTSVAPAAESEKAYMASITLTAPEDSGFLSGSALYAGVVNGLNNSLSPTGGRTTSLYVGATIPTPIEGLAVGAAYDYRASQVADATAVQSSLYANAVGLYVSYQHEKWKFNNRLEYTSGSSGTYYVAPAGDNNEFIGETFTVDYSLWANVISRLEFRWDKCTTGDAPFGDTDENALSLALNVIYKF